jgi:hypothetical protein
LVIFWVSKKEDAKWIKWRNKRSEEEFVY